jgi:hypothetical protein
MSYCPGNPNGEDGRHIFVHVQDIRNVFSKDINDKDGGMYACSTCGATLYVWNDDLTFKVLDIKVKEKKL